MCYPTKIYGRFYNLDQALAACPAGWHLPSDDEWDELIKCLGGNKVAGGKMKAKKMWNSPNEGATNSSGFNALPAGYYGYTSLPQFYNIGDTAVFWSSTRCGRDNDMVWIYALRSYTEAVETDKFFVKKHCVARCLRD